jgi:FRG domain-containing protein
MPEPSGAVKDLAELIDHSGGLIDKFKSHEVWWRGHSRAEWFLRPGVHREGRNVDSERNISVRFLMKAHTRHAQCPPESDFAGWLFLMQHYRLPTRLLDWTESSLIAAFFAVTGHPEEDGALWALDPLALNETQMGAPVLVVPGGESASGHFLPPFQDAKPQQTTLAIVSREVDVRMLIQQSAFTIHGDATPLDNLPGVDTFTRKYIIPAASKAKLRAQLKVLGFTLHKLFPDLEHLASDLAAMRFSP